MSLAQLHPLVVLWFLDYETIENFKSPCHWVAISGYVLPLWPHTTAVHYTKLYVPHFIFLSNLERILKSNRSI